MCISLSHRRLSCIDIEIDVVNDIVCAGGVKHLIAGVQVIPHAIFTEQLIKLSAGQLLCIFVLLGTKYHEFSLLCHAVITAFRDFR